MAQKISVDGLQFKQTRKKKYDAYVCMPPIGTAVTNRLEGAQYVTTAEKPYVMSGTVGETWVIDPNKLINTYTFADGSPITMEALRSRYTHGMMDWVRISTKQQNMDINFAAHLPLSVQNYPVQTSWGDVLYANRDGIPHGKGDFLVCTSANGQPNLNDMWVVNGEIFPATYDMRAFPGFGTGMAKEPPVPKSLAGAIQKKDNEKLKIAQYIMTGLKQRGNRIGKFVNDKGETCSFTVNNGRYGVILFINTGDQADGSNSISIMFHSNNDWTEAASWFIDDYGIDESINKIHTIVNGDASIAGMVSKVSSSIPDADQGNRFDGYTANMQKPAYFKQLLKTYEYVKDRLQLYELPHGLITETNEEPVHWRIDFCTRMFSDAENVAPFIDIDNNTITACVQANNGDVHYEESFDSNANGCKQAFQFIAQVFKELKQEGF